MLRILSNADLTQASVAPRAMDSAAGIQSDPQLPRASHNTPDNPDVPRLPIISAGGFEAHVLCAIGETAENTAYVTYLSLLGPGTSRRCGVGLPDGSAPDRRDAGRSR